MPAGSLSHRNELSLVYIAFIEWSAAKQPELKSCGCFFTAVNDNTEKSQEIPYNPH
jgi:hypothetical protein